MKPTKHTVNNRNGELASQDLDFSPVRKGGFKRFLLWSLVVLGVAAILIRWGMENQGAKVQFKTLPVTKGALTVTVTATGNLEPTNQVDVSSELSGIVKSVEVDYNDTVKVGQVLARLDTAKLEAQVLQSQAALEVARAKVLQVQATIRETRDQLERLNHLAKMSDHRAVSKSDLDAAQASLDRALADEASAKASVQQALAILEVNETDLSKTRILSPINGIVLTRSVDPGQTVAASLQAPVLFTLAEDLTHMQLHVDVDEADVGKVKAGQRATFTVDAYSDRSFPAHITQVRYGPRSDATSSESTSKSSSSGGVVTYETLLNVDNADSSLRPGMTATAEIVIKEVENAVLVPNAALRFTPPESQVDAVRTPRGNVLNRLFPRPSSFREKHQMDKPDGKTQQRVWVLRQEAPFPILIQTGLTDGTLTEAFGEDIKPGIELIIDAVRASL